MRSSLLGTIWLFLAVLMVTVYGKSEQKGNKKRNGQDDESEDDKFNDYEVYQTIENMRKLTGHDNFYDLLGIGTSANDEQIGRAFRKLSVKYHPDKHGKEMEPMFKLVQYVGTLLRDAKRRARYEWLMHEAPAWHRESVYAVRRMHKVNKISMRQFWMFTFGFLIFGQLVAQWITYILKAGRVKMARRNLQAMGDKEVKRIRKKLESGDSTFLSQNSTDFETVVLADSPLPPFPSPLDLFPFFIPLYFLRKLLVSSKEEKTE